MVVRTNLHGNDVPERKGRGDWYDMKASETVELKKGEVAIIPLGISIEIPEDKTAYILPRSSTCLKHGIMMGNSMGVIDHSYNGDDDVVGFIAFAFRDTVIEKGLRIAQMAVYPAPEEIEFVPVESLGNENRGGFGSTGKA